MGFHPWNLQSTLPTFQWIFWVMCQNNQAYIAACQVQWYKSKDCTTAHQGHPSWCQTSLTLSDAVQLQDTYQLYHLGSTILTQQPSKFKSTSRIELKQAKSYADKHSKQLAPFWCWSAHCHIWHPKENVDTCYSSLCPPPRTFTKYALWIEPSIAITRCHLWKCSVKCNDAVPEVLIMPHQNRLTSGFPDLCHSLPQPLNKHHNQLHLWPQNQNLLPQFLHLQPHQRSFQCLHPPLHQV